MSKIPSIWCVNMFEFVCGHYLFQKASHEKSKYITIHIIQACMPQNPISGAIHSVQMSDVLMSCIYTYSLQLSCI